VAFRGLTRPVEQEEADRRRLTHGGRACNPSVANAIVREPDARLREAIVGALLRN